jgi:hypothetical protein
MQHAADSRSQQEDVMGKFDGNDAKEETIFFDVSDEALERACGPRDANIPTLVGTYCLTCPAGQEFDS